MQQVGPDLILSATDLSGFLACRHLTTLERARLRGEVRRPYFEDPGNEVLRARGQEHEQAILARYRARGLRVAEPAQPSRNAGDVTASLTRSAEETLELMRAGADVVYQGCLFDGQWLGRPDFLVRVEHPGEHWGWSYEVVDAKLARSAKAGAVLQISAYSEMLARVQEHTPTWMHIAHTGQRAATGAARSSDSGPARDDGLESFLVADFAAYYRSVKGRYLETVEAEPATYPEPCEHCTVCDWSSVCDRRWREDDHLSLVAGITKKQRQALESHGVRTLEALAGFAMPSEPALQKIREQARIQLEGRQEKRYKHELLPHDEERMGLLALPEPSPGDLFFDIEGDPFAFSAEHGEGLEYLFGWVDADGAFEGLWALSPEEEKACFETFIDRVIDRLREWPELHVYHYAAYEPAALKRLAGRHATRDEEVDRLLRGQVFVDLYRVVRQGLRASVESYSIKKLEPLYAFHRAVDLRVASSALANFEAFIQLGSGSSRSERSDGASELLREIEGYNRDDCLSTLRLRDWLEDCRSDLERSSGGPLPRPAPPDPEASEKTQEESERVRTLMDALTGGVPADPAARTEEQHARWMLAHLLSWHRRENKSVWWEYFRLRDLDDDELIEDAKPVGGLEYEGEIARVDNSIIHRYRFPSQDFGIRPGDATRDPRTEKGAGTVVAVDEDACAIDLKRGVDSEVPHPSGLIPFGFVPDKVLRESLIRLADDILAHGFENATNRAAADLLLRRPPRAGQSPGARLSEVGESSLGAAGRIVLQLDRTVLPVQGPPGTGKTYIGARMILSLLKDGKRVGVTGPSHKVIVNLLDELCEAAEQEHHPFQGTQKADEDVACTHGRIERTDKNARVLEALTTGEAEVAAGTVWLWARPEMADSLDVLVVDEAGQMSLANVLAASAAAKSLVLLGDPRQLEQPQKGVHPPGTEVAALSHLVGGDTLSPDRGLFLEETWRLHPDVCAFTSERFYRGRLQSRDGLDQQMVDGPVPFAGTGLRLWPVEHEGNTSESDEEVEAVAELLERLFQSEPMWVDADRVRKPLLPQDVLVVSPYNAQVAALKARLSGTAAAGVPIGTVDKFQGQEAPVVIYSTATSTAEDAPRGMKFLYSPNRLNVATSRARCVAIWVGSPALLGPDCRSVQQMGLANGFARFGELAEDGFRGAGDRPR